MLDGIGQGGVMEETTKKISNNNEEVGGERVPLPEAILTCNPSPGHIVQEDNSFSGIQELLNPTAPFVREPTRPRHLRMQSRLFQLTQSNAL
jgi:hypothetical protein